jgi:uncharacterized protein YuzE
MKKIPTQIKYDPRADAAYIELPCKGPRRSYRVVPVESEHILLDFDKNGKLIGVEVLYAKNSLHV